jgi:2-iminobutanoate/2-iminopropanoate deaminase
MLISACSARQVIASRTLPAPRFHYSPVVQAGGFAFVSGLIALDPGSGQLAPGGTYGEARQILANLAALVDELGWTLEQLVLARVYCTAFEEFPDVNRAWEECFAAVVPPARTSMGVAALPLGAKVEMEFQFLVTQAASA